MPDLSRKDGAAIHALQRQVADLQVALDAAEAKAERLAEALRQIAEPTQINKREQIRKTEIARGALFQHERR